MPTLTPSRIQFSRAITTLPTLFVAPSVPPDALALIQEILEEYYFDGIDDIVSAELDNGGDIVGEFTDRVGAREVKRYQYRIADDEVSYGLLNSKEVAKFALTFAPMFGPGSRKGKKKTCTKGTPCGDTCIQASRMCRKKPGSAVKAKIKKAKEKLGGGGAIAIVPKKPEKGKADSGGKTDGDTFGVDPIDAKFASNNPSDADIQAWYKAKIDEKPTLEQAEIDVAKELGRGVFNYDKNGRLLENRIVDADSYAKTQYAAEQAERKRKIKFGLRQKEDESLILESLRERFGDSNEVLEKKIAKAKDEKTKVKLQKKLDDYKHWDEVEAPARAKAMAEKYKKIASQTRSQRIADLKGEFEALQAAKLRDYEDLQDRVNNGDKKAINKKREQVFNRIPHESRRAALEESDKPKTYEVEAVRKHLIAVNNNRLVPEFNLPKKFSQAEVKKAYRALSRKYHPDTGGSVDQFNRLTTVYQDLLLRASK